jgi:UDP-glucose 4-epimerase
MVLVTGGAWFIGSTLVMALVASGRKVRVIDDLRVGSASNVLGLSVASILDAAAVQRAVEACTVVLHLAARVAIRSSFDYVVEDTMTNVGGTATVLRAAQRSGSVRRFVTASSMAVYADSADGRLITELHPTHPLSPYGASKLCAESLTHQMCAHGGMGSVVLRLFNTYGVGQRLSPYVGVITIFATKLAAGTTPEVFGDGEQQRDFVHVDDVVQGFLRAMDTDVSGETFNIGTGVATTVNKVASMLQAALGTSVDARHVAAVPGELRSSVPDISKARRVLGYAPTQAFVDSIDAVARQIAGSARDKRTSDAPMRG